jgi:hypothetical protein
MDGILSIDSNPNSGIAINIETIIKVRKLTITTKIENISCGSGLIVRKAVNAIIKNFAQS